ncbi:MAG: DUF1836 domain-containing protein [Oscillospiraceae bacterium]
MEPLDLLKQALQTDRPVHWDDFPDISLYMDQVISYMPRQFINAGVDNELTPAMVNNYIKDGLLPRAEGKKYTRVHLAYLSMICALKQVLSVKEIKFLLKDIQSSQEPESLYQEYCEALDNALAETAESLTRSLSEESLSHIALKFALRSYADRLVCACILNTLFPDENEKNKKNKPD